MFGFGWALSLALLNLLGWCGRNERGLEEAVESALIFLTLALVESLNTAKDFVLGESLLSGEPLLHLVLHWLSEYDLFFKLLFVSVDVWVDE